MLLFVLDACLRLVIDLALARFRNSPLIRPSCWCCTTRSASWNAHVEVVRRRQADRLLLAVLARPLPKPS